MHLKTLNEIRERIKDDIYDLAYAEPSPDVYKARLHQLQFELACIEEAIQLEEKMRPLRRLFIGFLILAVTLLVIRIIRG